MPDNAIAARLEQGAAGADMSGAEHTDPHDPGGAFIVAIIGVLVLSGVFFVPYLLDESFYGASNPATATKYTVVQGRRIDPHVPAPPAPPPAATPVATPAVAAGVPPTQIPDLSGLSAQRAHNTAA